MSNTTLNLIPCPVKVDTTDDGDAVMRVDYCTADYAAARAMAKHACDAKLYNRGWTYQVVFTEVWGELEYHQALEVDHFARFVQAS